MSRTNPIPVRVDSRWHLPALDGLRGVAVLAVMLAHATYGETFLQGGSMGVDVFFVLSGFLITYLLVREYDTKGGRVDLRRFYLRRVLRLGPALGLLLLVVVVGGWIFFDHERAKANSLDALISLGYMTNWARAFEIHPPRLLGHTWSLSMEEQFYIIWPLLLIVLLRYIPSRALIIRILVTGAILSWLLRVVMALRGTSIKRMYNGLDTRADSLLVGCALGVAVASNLIAENAKPGIASRLKRLSPFVVLALMAVVWFGDWQSRQSYYWVFVLVELSAAFMILEILTAKESVLTTALSVRPLVWVGTISYGLYLWHYPIFYLLSEHGRGYRAVAAGTAATFVVASLSYYLMERPILRWKDRMASSVGRPT